MKEKFYVYAHVLNGEVIYVGKGSDRRGYFFSQRNHLWKSIVGEKKNEVIVKIVKRFADEDEAYDFEKELILHYKEIGQCRANIGLGKNHAEESKQKQSRNLKGENAPWFDKKLSDEHRMKMSEAHKGERNHLYGKTGADHNSSKPIVAIFPDGKEIKSFSRTELAAILKNEYDMGLSLVKKCINTGEPYKAGFKKNKILEGLIIKYVKV